MRMETIYPFTAVVGQEQAKKALLIALVNQKAGGLLIGGEGYGEVCAGTQLCGACRRPQAAAAAAECDGGYAVWQH